MTDNKGVRRREFLKGIGVVGAVAPLAAGAAEQEPGRAVRPARGTIT